MNARIPGPAFGVTGGRSFFLHRCCPSFPTTTERVDMDNDDTQEDIQSEHLAPIDAYNRALIDFGVELSDLMKGIAESALDVVTVSAHDAALVWIAASTAYRRLWHSLPDARGLLDIARFGLVERYHVLVGLLERAERQFPDTAIPRELSDMRLELKSAIEQSILRDTE